MSIPEKVSKHLFLSNLKSNIQDNTLHSKLNFIRNKKMAEEVEEHKNDDNKI